MTTRELIVSESTLRPNSPPGSKKQAGLFVDQTAGREEKTDIVMHDNDGKFTKEFTAKLNLRGLRTSSLRKQAKLGRSV